MKKVLTLATLVLLFTACNNDKTGDPKVKSQTSDAAMSDAEAKEAKEERNKQTALASVQAVNDHNADGILKDADPNTADYGDGSGPVMKNIDSMKVMMREWLAAFPDVKGENLKAVADGDYVMVWGDWSGTFKKDFMGMKATGKSYKIKDVDIFKFNDAGKITEHHFVQSPQTMMAQLGVKMNEKH